MNGGNLAFDDALEKECGALGGLFHFIVDDLKNMYPAWEDLSVKAVKLSSQLKYTVLSLNQFLDALQKIADHATNAKGATRDIGTALTRVCMRNRSIENRLKTLSTALVDQLAQPIQERSEEWRQRAQQLDKEHTRDYKKTKHDIKKRAVDTQKLAKKMRKGDARMQPMVECAVQEVNDRYVAFVHTERHMLRQALLAQRMQFCSAVGYLQPVIEFELNLLDESDHLREVYELLMKHTQTPDQLPQSSEAVILDIKGLEHTWAQGVPSPVGSPTQSSMGSRQSSFCSVNSADTNSLQYGTYTNRHNTQRMPPPASPARFSSLDSGVHTQEPIYAPVQMKGTQRVTGNNGTAHSDDSSSGSTPASFPSSSLGSTALMGNTGLAQHTDQTPSPTTNIPCSSSPLHQPLQNYSQSSNCEEKRAHTISAGEFDSSRRFTRPALAAAFGMGQSNRPQTLGLGLGRPPNGHQTGTGTGGRRKQTPLATPTPTACSIQQEQTATIIPDLHAAQPDQFVPPSGAIYANYSHNQSQANQQQIYGNYRPAQTSSNGNGAGQSAFSSSLQEQQLRCASAQSTGSGSMPPPPSTIQAATVRRRNTQSCNTPTNQHQANVDNRKVQRPLSFVGDDEDMQRLLQVAGLGVSGWARPTSSLSAANTQAANERTTTQSIDDDLTPRQSHAGDFTNGQYPLTNQRSAAPTNHQSARNSFFERNGPDNVEIQQTQVSHYATTNVVLMRDGTNNRVNEGQRAVSYQEQHNGTHAQATVTQTTGYYSSAHNQSLKHNIHNGVPTNSGSALMVNGACDAMDSFGACNTAGGTLTRRNTRTAAPAPPVRRNSSITAATPTAPSVEFVRANSRCSSPVEGLYDTVSLAQSNSEQSTLVEQTNRSLVVTNHTTNTTDPRFSVTHETLLMEIKNGVQLRRAQQN